MSALGCSIHYDTRNELACFLLLVRPYAPEMGAGTRLYSDQEAAAALRANPGRVQSSFDPWEATHQTVQYMCQLVNDSLADGVVQECLADCDRFRDFGRSPWASIWWWVKHKVKFVGHAKMLGDWIGSPDELQLLIRPDALLKMERPKGDCAVFTTLICALLDCAGISWEIVTVAADSQQPGVFSHVYPRVILSDGRRVAMDAIRGMNYPGVGVPRAAVSALQVWDSSGNPIEDQDSGYRGLHGVSMYGMGDATTDPSAGTGTGWDWSYSPGAADSISIPADYNAYPQIATYVPPSTTAPTTMPSQSASALSNLATQALSIFGQTVAPTTTYTRNANGSISYTTPGSGGAIATNSLLAGSASGVSSLLLYGGIAVAVLFVVMSMGKK